MLIDCFDQLKMVLTDDIILPSDEELTVQEINVSSPVLRATAAYMGYYCDEKCKVRLSS